MHLGGGLCPVKEKGIFMFFLIGYSMKSKSERNEIEMKLLVLRVCKFKHFIRTGAKVLFIAILSTIVYAKIP